MYEWEHHLYGSDVRDVVATDDALWLATFSGLVRMDLADSTLTIFRREARGLPSDSLNALAVDAEGNVWCGTESAGVAIRRARGGWDFVRTFDGLPNRRVLSLASRDGTIVAGTPEGFAVFADDEVSGCTVIDPCVDEMPSLFVQSVLPLDGEIWLGTSRGVARLAGGEIDSVNAGLGGASVLSLEMHEGELWCGTDQGPFVLDGGTETWSAVTGVTRSINGTVTDLLSTPDGLFCTLRSGPYRIYRWNGVDDWEIRLQTPASEAPRALAMDAAGRYWSGTARGVRGHDPSSGDWLDPIVVPGTPSSLPVWSVGAGADRAWIGYRGGIAGSFDGESWTEISPATTDDAFEDAHTQVVYRDRRGRVWFGHCCCDDDGCYADRLSETSRGQAWSRIAARNSRAITSDGGQLYFFGTGAEDPSVSGDGLQIWHESFPEDSIFVVRAAQSGLTTDTITGLAFGNDGRLWIGQRLGGVDVWDYGADPFDPSDDDWEHMSQSAADADQLLISNNVLALAARGSRVWVATTNGVTLFENGSSRGSFGQSTLLNPFVTTIATTPDGSAWAGSAAGVVRFVPNALGTFDREFYRFPELSNDAVNAIATDGLDVWVATQRGLAIGRPVAESTASGGGPTLGSAYPNPFRLRQHDGLRLVDVDVSVSGAVYDAAGGLVAEFRDVLPGGIVWDGRIESEDGGPAQLAAPGLYAIVARAGDARVTARVAVIR